MFNILKVKEELKTQNITQRELAKHLNIPATTLSDKLLGKSKFNADEVYKIANFLNRDLEYFYN
jgi:transcriptional regulator with XRE-family HTH domain